jgi:hypothetical protein
MKMIQPYKRKQQTCTLKLSTKSFDEFSILFGVDKENKERYEEIEKNKV